MKKVISILLTIAVVFVLICSVACQHEGLPKDKSTKFYDTITKTCKLTKDYEGKTFMSDGIGLATVEVFTDGDTTRFRTGGDSVNIRYYCIDTPESTGGVEKWGKAASNFVKMRLSEATEIVLESSTGGRPEKDSYNSRYLGFVWYKTADYGDFKLLNVELVENGFTDNKDINSPYYNYFAEAEKFARTNQIRKFGDDDDPLFSTDPISITLKEFYANQDLYYNEENDSGAKVIFTAYLESLSMYSAGSGTTHTFTAVTYDPATGERYEIAVYTGYVSSQASKLKVGNMYTIIGTVQMHNGKLQISGVNYNPRLEGRLEDGTFTVQENYYLTFDSSTKFIQQLSENLYSDLRVKSASVENGVLTIVADANQVVNEDELDQNTIEFTLTVAVPEGYVCNIASGDRLKLSGYQFEPNSHKIFIPSLSAITKK